MPNRLIDCKGEPLKSQLSLDQTEQVLVNAEILNVTLPLLFDGAEAPEVLGTGTLFYVDDRAFVVTAAHLFKEDENDPFSADIDLTKIAYPTKLTEAAL